MTEMPWYLQIYHKEYFAGREVQSGYVNYHDCRGVLTKWAQMVDTLASPTSVLDVGAAYGFLVEWFQDRGVPAVGVEPSDWARSQVRPDLRVVPGALPELPLAARERFDVVTCTEVLEHLPEELVPDSLQALGRHTGRLMICLTMLEGPGADGDEGHICLKSADWWRYQFTRALQDEFVRRADLEQQLNDDPYSRHMHWSTRFFVYERTDDQSGREDDA